MSQTTSFLKKCFGSLLNNIILPLNRIGYYLAKCAKSHTYIETLGKHADSLHGWISQSYEEDFQKAFQAQVKKALKHLNASYAMLAFDTTAEPFYGKTTSFYIFGTDNDKKWDGEFKFITVSLITRNKQIPLMALPIRLGNQTSRTIELVQYCQTLFKKIRFAVFDRGFYIGELIDYLESTDIKYLILVPEKQGRIADYVNQTSELGMFRHEMEYKKEKSTWRPKTTIVVCKGINEYAWIFATNLNFKTRVEYIWYYKRRWQIETNYRVEDEARIKSKSANYLIRYFYFLISLLFHLLWIVYKKYNGEIQFKKYLDKVEAWLFNDCKGIKGSS